MLSFRAQQDRQLPLSGSRSFHCLRIWEIADRQYFIERKVREIVAAKPARQPLATDLRIGQHVQLVRHALGFGSPLKRSARSGQAAQVHDPDFCPGFNQRLEIGIECERRRLLEVCGEDGLRMSRREASTLV